MKYNSGLFEIPTTYIKSGQDAIQQDANAENA